MIGMYKSRLATFEGGDRSSSFVALMAATFRSNDLDFPPLLDMDGNLIDGSAKLPSNDLSPSRCLADFIRLTVGMMGLGDVSLRGSFFLCLNTTGVEDMCCRSMFEFFLAASSVLNDSATFFDVPENRSRGYRLATPGFSSCFFGFNGVFLLVKGFSSDFELILERGERSVCCWRSSILFPENPADMLFRSTLSLNVAAS